MRPSPLSKLQSPKVRTLRPLGSSWLRLRSRGTKFRGLVLGTVALCALLPGCPLTDPYSIQALSAGSGSLVMSGGASELNVAGTLAAAGYLEAGGVAASGDSAGADSADSGGTGAGGTSTETGRGGRSAGGRSEGGTGGRGMSAGGMSSGGTGTAGRGAGAGGRTGSAGNATSGGTAIGGVTGTAGGPSLPQPVCMEGVVKGSPCTAASPSPCYKSCGPNNLGFKPETCVAGAYDELQLKCTFPTAQDYSCYKIPLALPEQCPPATVPRAGRLCQIPSCIPCFGGNALAPQYQDSTGAQKEGYCVCSEIGSWTCASTPSWPCPDGDGCH